MSRPLLLDLFSGAGGAAMGYFLAGWNILGIDKAPQSDYPFKFIQADLADRRVWRAIPWHKVDAVHMSPPCQFYFHERNGRDTGVHPDAIDAVRRMVTRTGKPYVIENVPGAPLIAPVTLCGSMFNLHTRDYELKRHRIFELNWLLPRTPVHTCGMRRAVTLTGDGGTYRPYSNGLRANGTGIKESRPPKGLCNQLMGIHWMPFKSLVQAIPPAYTTFLGRWLREELN